ncbi:uncharacterized protein CTRU02_213935 [Colletotrichum truncatum]|uniref:Uncharacterized protein n=1 Tax=Colletotrichum truncatum TaxID=5467 RepID=A0ACC3YH38_COLTU|nr:uncharacterized protein CTRU02_06248 [Colletotrichum truncatum]KAF6792752.1 hypothetical protein CTRU02_06248 [Colletotrichum truncatum]
MANMMPAHQDVCDAFCSSQDFGGFLDDFIRTLNMVTPLWECLTIGLLALDLAITLHGISSKIADTVLLEAHANTTTVLALTELITLMQLLQMFLPAYPTDEFESLELSKKLRDHVHCKWIGGLFGTYGAEFAASIPRLDEGELRTFGLFLIPVGIAVVRKWRNLRRRLRELRRMEEEELIAGVFRG